MAEHEQISFEDEIRRYWKRQPFLPFTIVLSSGDLFQVTDPDRLAMGESTVVLVPPTGIEFFRKSQIVAVQVKEPAA